jgi:hypothetical protein
MELVSFEGWPNCIRLSNEEIELIISTDIGPRILRLGFIDGQNILYLFPDDKGQSGGDKFRYYGGHRLWHSPEVFPRTYAPDNFPVNYEWDGKTLKLIQDIEKSTGIVKEIEITLNQPDGLVHSINLQHRLINKNLWDIELAPWAITALAPGGNAIIPQEPFIDPADYMLPARPMVLWHYTRMNDPHWIWGEKFIQLKQDSTIVSEQKIGLLNKQKWCAYHLNGELFIKTFPYDPQGSYPDYDCNNEIWADRNFLELETLGPLAKISSGGQVEHTEKWVLTKAEITGSEESIKEKVFSLVEKITSN